MASTGNQSAPCATGLKGISKPDPDSPGGILFDPTGSDGIWVSIPATLIGSMTPPSGQGGPVSLVLSVPSGQEAAALAGLLHAYAELAELTRMALRHQVQAGGDGLKGLAFEAPLQTEEAAPWSDGPCQSECDRQYPDNWRKRWTCKIFCP